MKTKGTGSKLSPISIDDSEDEVLQELVGEPSFHSNTSSHNHLFTTDSRNKLPGHSMVVGHHLHPGSDGKRPQKRKRGTNDLQSGPVAGPSQPQHPLPSHPASSLVSKKAKKRRRRLERQAMEAEIQPSKYQPWANGRNYLSLDLTSPPMLHSWPTNETGFGEPPFQADLAQPFTSYAVPQYPAESQSISSSAWVASMARAADTPVQDGSGPWESYPLLSKWPDFLQPSPPPAAHHIHPPPAIRPILPQLSEPAPLPDPPPAPAAPPAPPPVQSIGMKPDQDPSSKHGLYEILLGAPLPTGNAAPYIPNPARTLVMEQLPKSHRTKDFVNSWSKSACGAYPVYVHVDQPAAKALIEFATAELARKAWSSPRLGAALVGLKTNQLKGRPREDLIKVWWYRVDGVGANAGVGEIEEGEIEGDAAEKEVEVPVKKETKKERKARLARERQAKQKTFQLLKPKLPPTQTQSQATAAVLPETSIPKGSVTPSLLSLPPNPTLFSPTEHGFPYYPAIAIAPTSARPYLHHRPLVHPPAPVGPSLLPQSALAAQWLPKHELPRRPQMQTLQEHVASQQTLAQNGSISSSIASSRSPSPAQLSPQFLKPQVATPTERTASPDHEDMEVDDDMELESPQTGKRAQFDITLTAAPIRNYAISSASVPPTPSAVLTARGEDVDSTPDDTVINYGDSTSITTSDTVSISEQSLLDPISPLPVTSITPPSVSGTPPLEPRAMRAAPKGPSYAKRSLLARQKELAERIAKSKMELGLITTTAAPAVSTINASIPRTASPVHLPADDESDKQAMEDRLRSLVLKSQRNRVKTPVTTPSSSTGTTDPSPISPALTAPATPSSATAVSPMFPSSAVSTLSSHNFSLDDLAVSFITETIETIKATPTPTPSTPTVGIPPASVAIPSAVLSARTNSKQTTTTATSAVTANTATATKLELAEKQKRLEAQIAESKVLMAKLQQARTKQERESIVAVMRERSRTTGDGDDGAATATAIVTAPAPAVASNFGNGTGPGNIKNNTQVSQAQAQTVKKWPVSHEHAGIFIVSDDEEDDDSVGDDMA